MYDHVLKNCAKLTSLKGKTIVEVGSGRGGGFEYLCRILKPTKAIGVDYCKGNVDFCK